MYAFNPALSKCSLRVNGTLPLVRDMPENSERRRIHEWLAPLEQAVFLKDALNITEQGSSADWHTLRDTVTDRWQSGSHAISILSGEGQHLIIRARPTF